MSEMMVERVARAICKSRAFEGFSCCRWPSNRWRTNARCPVEQGVLNDAARAAIEAMRVPTEGMIEASNREWDGRMSHRSSGAWRAMIDAALGEASG